MILKMIGNSLVMTPLTTEALNVLPPTLLKHGTAMVKTFRQVGGSIGTGLLVVIQTIFSTSSPFIGARAFFCQHYWSWPHSLSDCFDAQTQ
ncbi:hypothetical protein RA086_07135 [Lactiplantibacillus sp. WILCCON 0030]|uniref:Uncharacterized protein n=2 Tax=Lactiplantibacillus brownii TaxID=3069269 RepID=A0ABU1AAP1_9LACO|nr:hypothetical protein [Lactiplantibacillus brownii]MDQ7937400.1 hypothetical protein [Lactiplantibacillus brownii]